MGSFATEMVDFQSVNERQNRVSASEVVDFEIINERRYCSH